VTENIIVALAIYRGSEIWTFHKHHKISRLCSRYGVGVTYLGVGRPKPLNG